MQYHHSLLTATKVLNTLFTLTGKDEDRLIVQCWSNGREQGYHIYNGYTQLATTFAEARNSDQIIVIHGKNLEDFNPQTNQPTEEAFKNNYTSFDSEDYLSAAQHILQQLGYVAQQ